MANETFYTAVDLGTSKTCAVIARIGAAGDLKLVGLGVVDSQGVQQGRVVNIVEAGEALQDALKEARRYIGRRHASSTYVTISGDHISCLNTEGHLRGSSDNGGVTPHHLHQLIQSSYPEVSDNAEILHVIPIAFEVDGMRGVRDPVGLHADHVKVESHIILGQLSAVRNLVKVVEARNLSVRSLVAQSLASAEAILTQDERELGVVLVDIGAGTIDLTIFRGGNPWYSGVIPIGGNQMTRDLSAALDLPLHQAEELKLKWGHALPHSIEAKAEILVPGTKVAPARSVSQQAICQPLADRLHEIMRLVMLRVSQTGLRQSPIGGMVLTGGCAAMPGFADMARAIVGTPVRVAWPGEIAGLPSQLMTPAFSASIGTLLWGIRHQGQQRSYLKGRHTLWGYKSLFGRWKKDVPSADDSAIPLAWRRAT